MAPRLYLDKNFGEKRKPGKIWLSKEKKLPEDKHEW